MIKDSNKKLFDTVIVWKLDRFARNRYDSARHKATLKKNGVKVVSATEAIADGSVGIMMETILEGMAEYYSVDLSEKVVRGMTDNALKCMFNGGTKISAILPSLICTFENPKNNIFRLTPLPRLLFLLPMRNMPMVQR